MKKIKQRLIVLALLFGVLFLVNNVAAAQAPLSEDATLESVFADTNLASIVANELNKTKEDKVTESELDSITSATIATMIK